MSTTTPKMLRKPTPVERTNIGKFQKWLLFERGVATRDYQDLWRWSVENLPDFWEACWQYFKIKSHSRYKKVLSSNEMPFAKWFEGSTLNYAEHIFRMKTDRRPALIFQNEKSAPVEMSWAELERQVASLAATLREMGVGRGDCVAAFLPNTPHAVVGALASMSIGAIWSSCSPDFGASSVVDRFQQIRPKVLIACDGYGYGGKAFSVLETVGELQRQFAEFGCQTIFVPYFFENQAVENFSFEKNWADAVARTDEKLTFEAVPFDHPIWVLYSSGTTGLPKAITHSHGGNLLEHLKYLTFHNDLRAGERFFWFSTTGWMMWNFTLAALLGGATIVLYDGSPGFPDLEVLWKMAADLKINHFGTSAPFLVACMKNGIEPGKKFDLKSLRSIGSTGSPLPPEAFDYVLKKIKRGVWLASMAGGTDVCTAWVGGNPGLPVFLGEIQCRCLGASLESWDEDGKPVPAGEVGEMVVTRPMPSMPVFFWNDPTGEKYRSSYFEHFEGVWRHGDWLQITERQTLVILGRSDATLNRGGVRIGTAEIYRAMDRIEELRDCLIINVERADGSDWMPLFVCLQAGQVLDENLKSKIKKMLRTTYSPRHVPDEILEVPDIPYTISGKKMESPVKKIFQRKSLDKAFNRDSMRNPAAMEFFISLAG